MTNQQVSELASYVEKILPGGNFVLVLDTGGPRGQLAHLSNLDGDNPFHLLREYLEANEQRALPT